jgi:hypothetical protein
VSYTPKAYKKVQLVAYHTPTFLSSDVSAPAPVAPIHPAIQSLMNADERSRVTRMYLVALWAATHKNVDPSETTMKLFVAPEFYFKTVSEASTAMGKGMKGVTGGVRRSAGKYGAYSFNTMQNIMACLRTIFTSPVGNPMLLKHWLLIPGTIVSDLPADGKSYRSGDCYYLNTAVIIKGEKDGPFHFVQKHHVSPIDGPPTSNGVYSGAASPYKKTLEKLAAKGHDEAATRLFSVDNIKFGLEVCLDHAKGVVAKQKSIVDIHVVTSCGMFFVADKVMAKTGGYAMICDGGTGNDWPRSDVRKITSRGTSAVLEASKWDCAPDSGTAPKRWRSTPPKLTGSVKGRAAIPDELKVKPLATTAVFGDGKQDQSFKNEHIPYYMFPEEIVWYEPVSL